MLSSCGGTTREDILGQDGSNPGNAGEGGTDSVSGGSSGSGGSSQAGGSAGTGTYDGSGGTSGGAGGTASGDGGTTAGTGGNGECAPSGDPGGASAPAFDGGLPENLISDPSFESGHAGWVGQGSPTIVDVDEHPHTGLRCLRATNRAQSWMGPLLPIGSLVTGGASYEASAWVRLSADAQVSLTLKEECAGEATTFSSLHFDTATGCDWRRLSGQFVAPSCTLTHLDLVIEGASAGVDIFVDDVALVTVD